MRSRYVGYGVSFFIACGIILGLLLLTVLPTYFGGTDSVLYVFGLGFVVVLVGLTRLIYREFFSEGEGSTNL